MFISPGELCLHTKCIDGFLSQVIRPVYLLLPKSPLQYLLCALVIAVYLLFHAAVLDLNRLQCPKLSLFHKKPFLVAQPLVFQDHFSNIRHSQVGKTMDEIGKVKQF